VSYNPVDMKSLQLLALSLVAMLLIGCETTNQAGMGNQEQKRMAQIQRQQQEAAQYTESDVNLWNSQVGLLNRDTNPSIRY
jgi:outer membrane biogenesis lipoprotein LolB